MIWWFIGGGIITYLIIKAIGPLLFFGGIIVWIGLLYLMELINE